MNNKILFIGDTSGINSIGSMLTRATQELNLPFVVNNNRFSNYAPSMKTIWGKAFFKMTGKRPLEWWLFNHNIVNTILDVNPSLVLVTGIFPLSDEVFNTCSKINCKIANYLTDYPWNPQHISRKFLSNLPKYDLVLSTKTQILSELKDHGIKNVKFMPFAYDPFVYHQPELSTQSERDLFSADVSFIGMGDIERIPFLEAIASLGELNLKIYGPNWNKIHIKNWKNLPPVVGNDYRLAIRYSKITLGIVRKRNRDQSTMRTFEIATCGGCGIYEDSSEHREILSGYPDYGFFSSPEDLAEKCKWLLENPIELEQMRQMGINLIATDDNTYAARLKKILRYIGELQN